MAGSQLSASSRYLVTAGIGLIGVQFALVALMGFEPPQFKAGYHVAGKATPPVETQRIMARERHKLLEEILSPVPVLAWADQAEGVTLPEAILDPAIILSFKAPEEAVAAVALAPETVAAAPVTPALPAAELAPETVTEPAASAIPEQAPETIELAARLPSAPLTQAAPSAPAAPLPPLEIKPVYLQVLPDIQDLPPAQRKKQFIAFMLPLVLRANEELENRHDLVRKAVERNDLARLQQWGELYGYTPANPTLEDLSEELMKRVRPVPVSIALAQAAIESGWGTSRFARQGNALFGQWAWDASQGIRPKAARYDNVVIRSFASLFDSVRAYMHNLNSHAAYADFRQRRGQGENAFDGAAVDDLVGTLINYSEEGEQYTFKLREVIRINRLMLYDDAVLAAE